MWTEDKVAAGSAAPLWSAERPAAAVPGVAAVQSVQCEPLHGAVQVRSSESRQSAEPGWLQWIHWHARAELTTCLTHLSPTPANLYQPHLPAPAANLCLGHNCVHRTHRFYARLLKLCGTMEILHCAILFAVLVQGKLNKRWYLDFSTTSQDATIKIISFSLGHLFIHEKSHSKNGHTLWNWIFHCVNQKANCDSVKYVRVWYVGWADSIITFIRFSRASRWHFLHWIRLTSKFPSFTGRDKNAQHLPSGWLLLSLGCTEIKGRWLAVVNLYLNEIDSEYQLMPNKILERTHGFTHEFELLYVLCYRYQVIQYQ